MQNNLLNMAINRIMSRNPQAKQMYETLKGKSENELKQYAENVAKEKGIDLRNFLGQYGFRY
jgi:hypothetical protein